MRPDVRARALEILDEEGVSLALLFGSEARGQARSGSDLDLAVAGAQPDLLALAGRLSELFDREVDVIPVSEVGYPLLQRLLREGRLFYEARPGLFADWRARSIAQAETDKPWFERMARAFLVRLARSAHG